MGQPQIRALKSYKFKVKVNPENIWEVREQWNAYIQDNDVKISGSNPYIIVERSPEAQKVFNKMGATFSKLQKKMRQGTRVRADWRLKEFHVKTDDQDEVHLLTLSEDLSILWSAEGVAATGFSEAELSAAVA